MSLFERIQNRRYNLQEGIDDKGNITPNPGDKKVEKSIVRNYNKKQKKFNQTNVTSSGRVKATSDILKSGSKPTVSQQKTADDVLGNLNRFFTDKSDSDTLKTKSTGDEGQFKGKPKKFKITGDVSSKASKVNQADVSKKAKEYTKKINKLEPSLSNINDIQLSLKTIETQLILVDDSVQALNNYKKQLNQSILEIQTEISALQQQEQFEEPLN